MELKNYSKSPKTHFQRTSLLDWFKKNGEIPLNIKKKQLRFLLLLAHYKFFGSHQTVPKSSRS